jgi:hypothetical protein
VKNARVRGRVVAIRGRSFTEAIERSELASTARLDVTRK